MKPGYIFTLIFLVVTFQLHSQPILNWQPQPEINAGLPSGIVVFKANGSINGDTITAWYSKTNISSGNLVFFPVFSEINQKPEKFYVESNDDIILMTNGGYFGTNVSYSLVLNDYFTHAPNIRAVNRSYNNTNYLYYPTRSAFGITPGLKAEAGYVYTFSNTNQTYAYPEPAPNTTSQPPLPQPDPDYPANGKPWNVSEAIGGGPLLIKDSTINQNYEPELFPNDITGSIAPRTAIGVTGTGDIIILVVDGRQDHSRGASLQLLSEILLELGCVEAINLDGGGSSMISVNGKVLNKPSDGNTRYIPSVVCIKKAITINPMDNKYLKLSQLPIDSILSDNPANPKILLFETGEIGRLVSPDLNPAKYRLEFFLSDRVEAAQSDSFQIILSKDSDQKDTVYINQQRINESQFFKAGSWQLGRKDTVIISNLNTSLTAQIGNMRLVKVASGLPVIDLIPAKYYDTHSINERVQFKISCESINTSRSLTGFKVYEKINNNFNLVMEREFLPVGTYIDSIDYLVEQDPDQIQLVSVIFDELNDSSFVYYTINIDNTPPSIGLGRNSVLEGKPGDSLKFELRLLRANDSRPLEKLQIYKNPTDENILLREINPNPAGDTVVFSYKILEEDLPETVFRFILEDAYGYSANRDYSYFFSDLGKTLKPEFKIFFERKNSNLHIKTGERHKNQRTEIYLYDLTGKLVYSMSVILNEVNTIPVPKLPPGIYLTKIISGTGIFHYKFLN